MKTNLTTNENHVNHYSKSINEIVEQKQNIMSLMTEEMNKDIHYGVIPSYNRKPSLLKPGAEKILQLLDISIEPFVTDLSTTDEIRIRVIIKGYYNSDVYAGGGVGECSSSEEKFKWRKCSCDQEYDSFPENKQRIKWVKNKYKNSIDQVKQVMVEPADQANTVLKIAKKRA